MAPSDDDKSRGWIVGMFSDGVGWIVGMFSDGVGWTKEVVTGDGGGVSQEAIFPLVIGSGVEPMSSDTSVSWAAPSEVKGGRGLVCWTGVGWLANKPGGKVGYFGMVGVDGIQATEFVMRILFVDGTYTR